MTVNLESGRGRIMLLGASGQVGRHLVETLPHSATVFPMTRSDLDLGDPTKIRTVIRDLKPGVIINAAAFTAVDEAETRPDVAWNVNAVAPGILAEEAHRIDATLVQLSTDYVFDGEKSVYTEADTPNPLNVYGESKLAGERNVLESGARSFVLRLSWVYDVTGRNFFCTILRLARDRGVLQIVDDQYGAPSSSHDISVAIVQLLSDLQNDHEGGIYHLPSGGVTTWFGFAQRILESLPSGYPGKGADVQPISTAQFPTRARRPPRTILCGKKLEDAFGIRLRDWSLQLRDVVAELDQHTPAE